MKKYFVGVDEIFLEVEVVPSRSNEFITKYQTITGVNAKSSPYVQNQPDKWGLECRIYFNGNAKCISILNNHGHSVEVRSRKRYRDNYYHRVNSQKLFWWLINDGLRLGVNII